MEHRTYQNILIQAKKLFNENGVKNTSMRAIADACGISVGNLTYHFKKKQDIVDAIMNTSFQDLYGGIDVQTMEDFAQLIRIMLESLEENRFHFVGATMTGTDSAKNIATLYDTLRTALDHLCANGIIYIDEKAKESLVTFIMLSHITWVSSSDYNNRELSSEQFVQEHLNLLNAFKTGN